MGKGPRIDCSKDVRITQQSSKDDADINVIVSRIKRGADVPGGDVVPRYGDITQVPTDLREALNQFAFAQNLFMSLDPKIRFRFQNDPVQMLDFLADPMNKPEAIELGLVDSPKAVVEPKGEVSQAPPSGGA